MKVRITICALILLAFGYGLGNIIYYSSQPQTAPRLANVEEI
ncbi:hypothetical protein [Nodularia sp. UHCC 0506]|nr:hypothetical protein [Nodularia sp. UHCC 0506]MEA5516563.1 hypothetical protein [Nodularia sp. UHCC 0506]